MVWLALVKRRIIDRRRAGGIAVPSHGDVDMTGSLSDGVTIGRELDEGRRRRGGWIKFAEEAMLFVPEAGREIERVDVAAAAPIAEGQRPELIDDDAVA